MLRIHDVDHYLSVRKFAEESFSSDGICRWESLYGELKTLADFTECGEPSLDENRQFRSSYPYDENFPLELTGTEKTRCNLFKDFAPYSFYFEVQIKRDGIWKLFMNGGLIFHGPTDNGCGGPPTYSVTLSPVDGWSIHT